MTPSRAELEAKHAEATRYAQQIIDTVTALAAGDPFLTAIVDRVRSFIRDVVECVKRTALDMLSPRHDWAFAEYVRHDAQRWAAIGEQAHANQSAISRMYYRRLGERWEGSGGRAYGDLLATQHRAWGDLAQACDCVLQHLRGLKQAWLQRQYLARTAVLILAMVIASLVLSAATMKAADAMKAAAPFSVAASAAESAVRAAINRFLAMAFSCLAAVVAWVAVLNELDNAVKARMVTTIDAMASIMERPLWVRGWPGLADGEARDGRSR